MFHNFWYLLYLMLPQVIREAAGKIKPNTEKQINHHKREKQTDTLRSFQTWRMQSGIFYLHFTPEHPHTVPETAHT